MGAGTVGIAVQIYRWEKLRRNDWMVVKEI
jgi:hypothetical protein